MNKGQHYDPRKLSEPEHLQERPLKPKSRVEKAQAYRAQTGRSTLTPAQNRRIRKTDNRATKVARQQKGGRKR